MEFNRPRGTRDFLFDEMRERKRVETILRDVFESYAFQEVKTPIFEELNLFTTKSGEEIVDQLYNFKDKSDREITLRPELTAPIARLYLNELTKAAKPIKLYYYGSCFRYERPQKGRFRQFWQFGCELIGARSPDGEAEVLSMCNTSLEKLGINSAEININHLGIIRGLFKHFDIDEDTQRELMIVIDKGDKDLLHDSLVGEKPLIDNPELNAVLLDLIDMVGDKTIISSIEDLVGDYEETVDSLDELKQLIKNLDYYGLNNYKLNLGVARGLDYYTGIVFEVYIPELGAQKQVCGGGTYSLIKLFGGDEVESTGFAFGFDRLMNAIDEPKVKDSYVDAFVVPINEETHYEAFNIATRLRNQGIRTEVDLSTRKFKKVLKLANKLKVPFVVMVGKRDLEQGALTVKNMYSGEQEVISIGNIAKTIKENL
jgi:histidyl-tRNA synthetase